MSIQRRLALSITLVLLVSLAIGSTPDPVAAPAGTRLPLPSPFDRIGTLTLDPDPHNEVAEAWDDVRLTVTIMAVFFAMVLALAFLTIRSAVAPLREVCDALLRVGAGDNSVRVAPHVSREFEPLRERFNAMAGRLEAMGRQNRALQEQIITLQEEERAELARDLHDDVGPFLFAVGADAAMIRQYLATGASDAIGPRAEAIAEAVRHMQRHLKHVLRRLAPGALLDLGLPGAIDDLVAFWRTRRPEVAFAVAVEGEPLDPPLDAIVFRVVQESLANAMRHGQPRSIEVMVLVEDDTATVVVEDDGRGFAERPPRFGFGLTGMNDRVRGAGGTMSARNRAARSGVRVEAALPLPDGAAGRARAMEAVP